LIDPFVLVVYTPGSTPTQSPGTTFPAAAAKLIGFACVPAAVAVPVGEMKMFGSRSGGSGHAFPTGGVGEGETDAELETDDEGEADADCERDTDAEGDADLEDDGDTLGDGRRRRLFIENLSIL